MNRAKGFSLMFALIFGLTIMAVITVMAQKYYIKQQEIIKTRMTIKKADYILKAVDKYFQANCWASGGSSLPIPTTASLQADNLLGRMNWNNPLNPLAPYVVSFDTSTQNTIYKVTTTFRNASDAQKVFLMAKQLSPEVNGVTVTFKRSNSRESETNVWAADENNIYATTPCR